MKNLLKKMMLALAVTMVLGFGVNGHAAAEACRWGPADSAAERMIAMNPDANHRTIMMESATADERLALEKAIQTYNNTPPLSERIEPGDIVSVVILDKPTASTIILLFLGEKCFLAGMELPKMAGPTVDLGQDA